jgi:hypothetical protein
MCHNLSAVEGCWFKRSLQAIMHAQRQSTQQCLGLSGKDPENLRSCNIWASTLTGVTCMGFQGGMLSSTSRLLHSAHQVGR